MTDRTSQSLLFDLENKLHDFQGALSGLAGSRDYQVSDFANKSRDIMMSIEAIIWDLQLKAEDIDKLVEVVKTLDPAAIVKMRAKLDA